MLDLYLAILHFSGFSQAHLHEGPGPIQSRNKASLLGKNLKLAYILCFRDSHRPALHASPHLAKSKTFLFGKRSKALEWHDCLQGTTYGAKSLGLT